MIKIDRLTFEIGDRVRLYDNRRATVTGYIQYNTQFFYIVVPDGSEESIEAGWIEKIGVAA